MPSPVLSIDTLALTEMSFDDAILFIMTARMDTVIWPNLHI